MKKNIILILAMFICQSVCFAMDKLDITYFNDIYHIIIPSSKISGINFVLSDKLITNQEMHKKMRSKLTINTGFFDPVNQKTISYIYTDGILTENPLMNENIINNSELMDNWVKISGRTEFRVLKTDRGYECDIAPHDAHYEGELITSAQGGPMLLPEMDLDEEFFVVIDDNGNVIRESASVLHQCARTLIGIKNNDVHIFIITDKNPMTIYEAKELCETYKLDKAMAFDGGSSTSMNYKNKIHVVSTGTKGDNTGRKLKSFLIFK